MGHDYGEVCYLDEIKIIGILQKTVEGEHWQNKENSIR